MNVEDNKRLVRRLHEIWNTGDLDAIPEVFGEAFVAHYPRSAQAPERRGLDALRRGMTRTRTAFPDWHEHVEDMIAEGDRVVTRYTSTGTHRGEFWGVPPTGRRLEIREMSIYRIAEGRVVEQWCYIDELDRLQQLGVLARRPQIAG